MNRAHSVLLHTFTWWSQRPGDATKAALYLHRGRTDTHLPRCIHKYIAGPPALWGHSCWKPLAHKWLYTLCVSFTRCVPSTSVAVEPQRLWAHCQLGIGQCADSSDLGRCRDAEQGKSGCKVRWQFGYCGKRTSSFCTTPISVKARITPFKSMLILEEFTYFGGSRPLYQPFCTGKLHCEHVRRAALRDVPILQENSCRQS